MKFIGIDLAWSYGNNTAISVLSLGEDKKSAYLDDYAKMVSSDEEILDTVEMHTVKGVCVSIDAPLIVKNRSGARPVDKEVTARFRKFYAGAHPCNLNRFGGKVRGIELIRKLKRLGLRHNPYIPVSKRRKVTSIIIEVYPHPAQVVLFGLTKRILYKRGNSEIKRQGLLVLRNSITEHLIHLEPNLKMNSKLQELCTTNIQCMRGKNLKSYEDTQDSLLCAYTGFYHWYWGEEKSDVIGNLRTGYLVTPGSR
ncbi:MAG: DUF429 domain-containing protein [Candidatus Scalindua sp.]|nr:DUF429 domain-containing protein [Candidatus Scalindua sp.]